MSENEEQEKFLSRWSRRKTEARGPEGETKPADPPEAPVAATPPSGACESAAPSTPGAPLPSIEELRGLESEYRDFLRPEVDESLRRTALKKLFQDPHFNIMDGLDTYIDDYTKADPIPETMLRGLNQAQGLLFDREDEPGAGKEQHAAADAAERPPQFTEEFTEEVTEDVSEDVSEEVSEEVSEDVTEEVSEDVTKLSSPEAKEDGNRPRPGPDKPPAAT